MEEASPIMTHNFCGPIELFQPLLHAACWQTDAALVVGLNTRTLIPGGRPPPSHMLGLRAAGISWHQRTLVAALKAWLNLPDSTKTISNIAQRLPLDSMFLHQMRVGNS